MVKTLSKPKLGVGSINANPFTVAIANKLKNPRVIPNKERDHFILRKGRLNNNAKP